jgi:tetratricopeptide (TPR) repeat protein
MLNAESNKEVGGEGVSAHRIRKALGQLARLGLVQQTTESVFFQMESVFLQSEISDMVLAKSPGNPAAQAAAEKIILELLARRVEFEEGGSYQQLRRWREHIQFITDRAFERSDRRALTLCMAFGRYLKLEGLYERSLHYMNRVLSLLTSAEDTDPELIVEALNEVGVLMQATARYSKALSLFEDALKMLSRIHHSDQSQTAQILNNLGTLRRTQGEFDAAESLTLLKVTFDRHWRYGKLTWVQIIPVQLRRSTIWHCVNRHWVTMMARDACLKRRWQPAKRYWGQTILTRPRH